MSDERFEEFLQREAKAYNEPSAEVPRDEMWAALSKARATRVAPFAADAPVTSRYMQRPARGVLRYASWIGMAATLLIGVGIGRYALQRTDRQPQPDVRMASAPASDAPSAEAATGGPTAPAFAPATAASPSGATRDQVDQPPAAQQVATVGTRRPDTMSRNTNVVNGMTGASAATPYTVASQRHMASAEALITVVTATPRDAMMDSLTTRWAREMLSSTRLLLDSPAGDDALRRRLLEDLETLLVQLVQRSGGAVDERDLIDRTLQRTQLLTRLRTNATGT